MPFYCTDPTSEDCAKCGGEINQLHNQQFLLATTATTLFVGYAGFVISRLLPDQQAVSPEVAATVGKVLTGASVAVFAVFFVFFKWSLHLRKNSKIIAVWLELTGKSAWERDIRNFSNRSLLEESERDQSVGEIRGWRMRLSKILTKSRKLTPVGQTKNSSEVFLYLGLLTAGVFIWIWLRPVPQISISGRQAFIVCFSAFVYSVFIVYSGIWRWQADGDQKIREAWRDVLGLRAVGGSIDQKMARSGRGRMGSETSGGIKTTGSSPSQELSRARVELEGITAGVKYKIILENDQATAELVKDIQSTVRSLNGAG